MEYRKIAFVFGGMGSQWETMGSGLLDEPVFHQAIEACDHSFRSYAGWSIKEELFKDGENSRIHDPFVAYPCICALEIALADLFKSWGIQPDAIIGHSAGELAAAYTAGILAIADVFKITWNLCLLVQKIRGTGTMAHISLSSNQINEILRQYPGVFIAAYNSPVSTVIAGKSQVIQKVTNMLGQKQVFSKILNIGVPLHTPMIEPHKEMLYQGICGIRANPSIIPMYSSLFGRLGKNGDYDARYWADQIREPVMFGAGIEAMHNDGYQLFLEISPNTVLMGLIDEAYRYAGNTKCTVIPTLERRKNEKTAVLTSIAHLTLSGYPVQLERFRSEDVSHINSMTDLIGREQQSHNSISAFAGMSGEECRQGLTELVKASLSKVSHKKIVHPDDEQATFSDLGADSLISLQMQKILSSQLHIPLSAMLLFDYPDIKALVDHILTKLDRKQQDRNIAGPLFSACNEEPFELFDFSGIRDNPLFGKMSQTNLSVTRQNNRELEIQGREFTDFASCNYLGLDYHPEVMEAIPKLVEKWGVHPSWTRFVASPAPYFELEERLAELTKAPSAIVFPCIALMNVGILPILAEPDGVIICDAATHHTVQEAVQLASTRGITCTRFRYDDLNDLEEQLKRYRHKSPIIVAVDGVYSMTVKYLDLPAYSELVKKYNAYLFVDDAHGIGVIGENPAKERPYGFKGNGIVNYFGMDYEKDHVIYISGLSKAFSSFAAFITCCDDKIKEKLRLASTYVFSGPVPVASLASALAGIEVNKKQGDDIRLKLYQLSERLVSGARALGFEVDNSGSFPIVFVVIGGVEQTVKAVNIAWERGLIITPGIFPMVPMNRGGLRFSVTALNTEEQIDKALHVLNDIRDNVKQFSKLF